MSWLDRYRPASFRGVPFFVANHEYASGRRIQNHQFPFRTDNYTEDLGKKSAGFRIEGYLVDRDYDLQRNRLLVALNSEGPGELVHPYLGTISVSVADFNLVETKENLNFCTINMTFVESGTRNYPTDIAEPSAFINSLADNLKTVNNSIFDRTFSFLGTGTGSVNRVNGIFGRFSNKISGLTNARTTLARASELSLSVNKLRSDVVSLVNEPARVRTLLTDTLDALDGAYTNTVDKFRALLGLSRQNDFELSRFRPTGYVTEATTQLAVNNLIKFDSFARAVVAADEIEVTSTGQQLMLRNQIINLLREIESSDVLIGDEVVASTDYNLLALLQELEGAVLMRFPEFNSGAITESSRQYTKEINAISALYDLKGNINDLDFFISNNEIVNPNFISIGKRLTAA